MKKKEFTNVKNCSKTQIMIKNTLYTIIFLVLINSWGSVAQTLNSSNFDEKFRSFWSSTISELNAFPFNTKKLKSQIHMGKIISLYELNSYANVKFHIYVSEPIENMKLELNFGLLGKEITHLLGF